VASTLLSLRELDCWEQTTSISYNGAPGTSACWLHPTSMTSTICNSKLLRRNQSHSGIVAIQQQSLSVGERMRRLIKLWSAVNAEDMVNRIEFLSHW